jgi:hypothetical protein
LHGGEDKRVGKYKGRYEMMVFPGMLTPAAKEVGMKMPADLGKGYSIEDFKEEYPHFYVFCVVQLCRSMRFGEQFDNAKIIQEIPEDEIMKVTLAELLNKGLHYQT